MENEYGMFCSEIIKGLCIERLTKDEWKEGQKIRIWFEGEAQYDLIWEQKKRKESEQKREMAEERWGAAEMAKLDEQKKRQEAEKKQQEAEKKAMFLAEKLRSLGLDPDNLYSKRFRFVKKV